MLSIKPFFLLLLLFSVVVVYFTFIFKLTQTKSSQNFSQILILRVKSLKWNSFKINPLPVHTAGLTSTTTGCPQPGSSPGHSQMWHQILLWTILFVTPPCVCPLFRVHETLLLLLLTLHTAEALSKSSSVRNVKTEMRQSSINSMLWSITSTVSPLDTTTAETL